MPLFHKKDDKIIENILKDTPKPNKFGMLENLPATKMEAALINTATLAFLGDAVYSLLVRERLSLSGAGNADELHKAATNIVNAGAQAEGIKRMLPYLNEKEMSIFKRGRNMHTAHRPKSSSEADYHLATGLESLFGYLYLSGEFDRIYILFEIAIT